ncbi:MAG TPA: hypothetical protein VH331_03155 [Allosphingosinicella sp.]|jgi:hypothetical protein|nr:hypothetical protein [Allosphingosinicella sp.]
MPIQPSAALILATALTASASAQSPTGGRSLFVDPERKVEVTYTFIGDEVLFSAHLPAEWSFKVNVDGDQNGVWGYGPSLDMPSADSSADHSFGRDKNGTFCAQYILSSFPQNPSQTRVTSDCDGFPSKGSIEICQEDAQHGATMTLKVPIAEVFGNQPDAHLQVCVWDTNRSTCQYTLAKPFILVRPASDTQNGHS